MRIGHGELELDVGPGGKGYGDEPMEPQAGELAALGAVVPVLA